MTETTRRTVIAGAAGLSATAALAACGDDTADVDTGDTVGDGADQATSTPTASPSSSAGTTAAGIAALADIPVNGGKIFAAEKVVVTQPTAGQVKAYSTTCTHQGCAVTKVENGLIICPCHDSRFKIADGTPSGGPATKPLQSKSVKVENGQVVLS